MATSRRRTAKSTLGQNLNDLDKRLKQVERRPRASVSAWSVTGDMLAPGSITLDKLDPALLALLQQTYSSGDATGDTAEEQGYGITDAILSSAEFSTNAANGKNSLFFQDTPPDEGTYLVDDIWYDTSLDDDGRPKYTPYQWDGDSWEPAPFGDASFRFLNAGKIATGTLDAAQVIRVGQYPTPEGKTRLEISGGNGVVDTATTLVSAVTSSSTAFTVASATGMPSSGVFNIKVDYGLPTEEIVTVTARTGTTLTVQRGVSGSAAYAHDAGATVTYSSTLYAGITVLKNPVGSGRTLSPADQANLTALFRLDASAGSLFIGEGDDYLKFNTSDSLGKLSISGQLLVGTGSESVAVGPNISGQQDGIRLGPNNWWYRPSSTLAEYPSGNLFFQVGMGGSELISVHTDGTVTVEGGVSPVRGTIKGRLGIRLAEGNASDKFLIGQNLASLSGLSGDEFDGIKLNASNYWVLSNTGKRAYLRVGGSVNYVSYNPVTDKLKLSGQLVAGEGTTNTVSIGADVGGNNVAGMKIDNSNFWYDADKVSAGTTVFKVSGANTTAITVNKAGDVTVEGITNPTGGTVKGRLSIRLAADNAAEKFLIGQNLPSLTGVSGDEFDGIKLDTHNYWVLSNTGKKSYLKVGTATKNLFFDGSTGLLKLTGGDITLTGGGTFKTADANTRVEMTSDGIFGYKAGTANPIFYIRASDGTASFEGETNPTGGTVKGKLTIQNTTYAFGKDVMSTRDGLYLNANNYWTLSQTGATAQFKVGGASKYVEWTGGALNISGDITSSTFTGGTIRTAASGSRVEMADSGTVNNVWSNDGTIGNFSANDRIAFYSGSTVENVPGYIRTLFGDTAVSQLQIFGPSSTTWGNTSGGVLPPSIKLQNGVGLTGSNRPAIYISVSYLNGLVQTSASEIQLITEDLNFFSTDPVVSGVLVGTTPTYVLGLNSSGQLKKYSSVGGSGGYSNATDGTTTNKITYGPTAPTSGRTAGDIHIEF